MTTVRVRHPLEIQRVHDMLDALVQAPELFETLAPHQSDRDSFHTALDAFCWVLGHDSPFEENLRILEERLGRLGVIMAEVEAEASAEANPEAEAKPETERTN